MPSLLFNLADWISDDLPAFFLFLVALELWIARSGAEGGWKGRLRSASVFWLRYALCVGVAVTLAEAGKHFQVWPGHLSFPSGHTTLVAASATALVSQRGRRWA